MYPLSLLSDGHQNQKMCSSDGVTNECCRKDLASRQNGANAVLRQELFNHMTADVGQAEAAALVFVGKLFVVDTKQTEHRCVEVIHVDRFVYDVVAEFVGFA